MKVYDKDVVNIKTVKLVSYINNPFKLSRNTFFILSNTYTYHYGIYVFSKRSFFNPLMPKDYRHKSEDSDRRLQIMAHVSGYTFCKKKVN